MDDIAIKFENISKQYLLGQIGTGTLSHDLKRWWIVKILSKEDPYLQIGQENGSNLAAYKKHVWALKDINLDVKHGEVLGIIGKNGAGKSTLLKILSRVTAPTTGVITAYGRVASLLEIGTGFHPEMTGRENIFMNGSIMGMTKSEIIARFDEIVDFSGVERYINTPVKRYSSGMMVRLGFAIAAHLEPEVLIVDEVLAVGDAEFQKKAIGKMQEVSKEAGRTVLFVSHNMNAIKSLCTRCIVMNNGQISFEGEVDESIRSYLYSNTFKTDEIKNFITILSTDIKINSISVNGLTSNFLHLDANDTTIEILINGYLDIEKILTIEVNLYDINNVHVAFFGPGMVLGKLTKFCPGTFELKESIIIPKNLTAGVYYLDISITHPYVAYYMRAIRCVQIDYSGYPFISGDNSYRERGYLILESKQE